MNIMKTKSPIFMAIFRFASNKVYAMLSNKAHVIQLRVRINSNSFMSLLETMVKLWLKWVATGKP